MPLRKKLLFSAITVSFLLASSLALAELALRQVAKRQERPPENSRFATYGIPVRTNTAGFRDREMTVPKPHGIYRVAILGDSLTWGVGLAEDERYSNQLQRLLRGPCQSPKIEVVNMGLMGAPSTTERDVLLREIDRVEPDLVVIGFCLNDPQPRSQDWSAEGDEWKPTQWKIECGFDDVGLRHVGEVVARRLPRAIRAVPDWPEALDRVYAPESAEWQAFTAALADIKTACDQRYMPAPIFAPLLQNDGDYNSDRYLAKILEWSHKAAAAAAEAGFQTVSMEERFRAEGFRKRGVNKWDCHPDAQCNRVYAEELAKAIAPIVQRSEVGSQRSEE